MKTTRFFLCFVAALVLPNLVSEAILAQGTADIKSGVIKEIIKRGRSIKLSVEDDSGNEIVIPITPKIDFRIEAKGDKGFITKGQFIEGKGILTNQRIFLSDVTIHHIPAGKRSTKRGAITKAPAQAGQSRNAYNVAGNITASEPDKDYPDYLLVAVREASRGPYMMIEKNAKVTVASSDTSLLPENAKIRMEGLLFPNGKFIVKKATVKLPKALKSEDFLQEKK